MHGLIVKETLVSQPTVELDQSVLLAARKRLSAFSAGKQAGKHELSFRPSMVMPLFWRRLLATAALLVLATTLAILHLRGTRHAPSGVTTVARVEDTALTWDARGLEMELLSLEAVLAFPEVQNTDALVSSKDGTERLDDPDYELPFQSTILELEMDLLLEDKELWL